MFKRIIRYIRRQMLKSSRYRWYAFTPQISLETITPLLASYSTWAAGGRLMKKGEGGRAVPLSREELQANRRLGQKTVVYVCDGRTIAGGLADRFKGLLSLYAICRELGYDFRIHYTHPFRLEDYLPPAAYDWRIAPEELRYEEAAMLVLENTEDSDYQTRKQVQWLRRRLQEGPAMMHVITNSNYAYELDYDRLFAHLFRFSDRLREALEAERQRLGEYVSVSARFLSMLGDFKETGENSSLPEAEAEALMARCLRQIEQLHEQHPESTILVNSDSMRFLQRAAVLPYIYIVEGRVAHTDLMDSEGADAMHLKLFLDFFLISRASHIYLLRTGLMRVSGFPYAASRLTGAPFSIIEF